MLPLLAMNGSMSNSYIVFTCSFLVVSTEMRKILFKDIRKKQVALAGGSFYLSMNDVNSVERLS